MNIGQAAAASGVSAKMIRYYDQIGLVAPAGRSAAGYRIYEQTDIHTLRFIRRARDMGFAVEGIAGLLSLWRDRSRHSSEVKKLALDQVATLDRRIAELEGMRDTLAGLAACCHGDDRPDCPILVDLARGAQESMDKSADKSMDKSAGDDAGGAGDGAGRPARKPPRFGLHQRKADQPAITPLRSRKQP